MLLFLFKVWQSLLIFIFSVMQICWIITLQFECNCIRERYIVVVIITLSMIAKSVSMHFAFLFHLYFRNEFLYLASYFILVSQVNNIKQHVKFNNKRWYDRWSKQPKQHLSYAAQCLMATCHLFPQDLQCE